MESFQSFIKGGLPALIQQNHSVQVGSSIETVYEAFSENDCEFMAILDGESYVTSVSRARTMNLLSGRYGFALYARRMVERHLRSDILTITPSLPIHDVLDFALNSRDQSCYNEDVALLDDDGNFMGMISAHSLVQVQWGMMQENTEQIQKQREVLQKRNREMLDNFEALRNSQSRWQSLFDENPLATVLVNPDGEVENFNTRCREAHGSSIEKGHLLCTIFDPEDRPRYSRLFQESKSGVSENVSGEFQVQSPASREPMVLKLVFAHFPDTDQTAVLFLDITKEREAEQALIHETKAEMIDSLVGGIAHELNNKLSPLLGFLSLHDSSDETSLDLNSVASMMQEATQDAASIIRQLLEITRPGKTQKSKQNIVETVDRTLEFLALEARRYDCELIRPEIAPGIIPDFAFNASQIKQVITNLIINAFHAVENVARKEISVQVNQIEKNVVISVTDTGCGIPSAVTANVFDAFFTTKETGRGSGLGLSVCRNIARLHDGDLRFTTEEGIGTTFYLSLPLDAGVDEASPAPTKPPTLEKHHFPNKTALIADDEPYIAAFVGKALQKHLGINCVRAEDGSSAIEMLKDDRYDLIISDVRMPGVDGFGLFDWIQTHEPTLAERFIFVTGDAGGSAFEEKLHLLERPVIRKPFIVDELSETCKSIVVGMKQAV